MFHSSGLRVNQALADYLLISFVNRQLFPNAARRAKDMGYRNVYVISAGISGLVGASPPMESGEKRDT